MEKLGEKKKFDYKWIIVILCFMTTFTTLGFCSSTNQLFIKPVTEYLEISRSAFSITQTIRYVVVAIVNLFFGTLIVKFGAKTLMVAGYFCLSIAMLIYTFVNDIWLFYLGGIFMGLGFAWTGTSVIGYVVNLWFKENRGTVMGAVLCANGLGGAFAMQIVSAIIESNLHNPSYKMAYFVISMILVVVAMLFLIFFKSKPKNFSGELSKPGKKKARGQVWIGVEWNKLVKKPYFYGALICIFFTGVAMTGVNSISAAHMQDVGIDAGFVATVLSLHSIALAVFKFLIGFIYDRYGLRLTSGICAVTAIIVMLCLAFVSNTVTGMTLSMIYGIFSSLALPLETVMLSIYANDLFGERSFGKSMGIITAANTAGYAVGAPVTNLCYDLLGSYQLSLIACSIIMFGVMILLQFVINRGKKERAIILAEQDALNRVNEQTENQTANA